MDDIVGYLILVIINSEGFFFQGLAKICSSESFQRQNSYLTNRQHVSRFVNINTPLDLILTPQKHEVYPRFFTRFFFAFQL